MRSALVCIAPALIACAAPATNRPADTQPSSPPAVAQEGFIAADDGVRLFYKEIGSGSQTVIVPASLFLYRDLSALARG